MTSFHPQDAEVVKAFIVKYFPPEWDISYYDKDGFESYQGITFGWKSTYKEISENADDTNSDPQFVTKTTS